MVKATTPHSDGLTADVRLSLDEAFCPPRAADSVLIARVRARVLAAVVPKPSPDSDSPRHSTIRAGAGTWTVVSPGVERKLLWESSDAVSCLVRLAPGATVGRHDHLIDEECVVLEGSLQIGADLLLRAGDFHVGVKGLAHEAASSVTGAVVYLRGARPRTEPA